MAGMGVDAAVAVPMEIVVSDSAAAESATQGPKSGQVLSQTVSSDDDLARGQRAMRDVLRRIEEWQGRSSRPHES